MSGKMCFGLVCRKRTLSTLNSLIRGCNGFDRGKEASNTSVDHLIVKIKHNR